MDIGNVGGQGGVASEATLAKLLVSIEAMARKAGIDPKAEAAKLQKLHNQAVKSGITTFDNSKTAQKENTKAVGKATQSTNKFARAIGGAMMGALGSAAGAIKGLGNELLQGGDSFGDFTKHIPLIGSYLGPLASLIDNSVESFRQLSSVGAGLGNSVTEIRRAAANMGLNMDEYAGFITSNSQTLRALGGTVAQGAIRFEKMNKNLKDTGDFEYFKSLGFTIEDINEGMAGYIDLQTKSGRLQGKTAEELAAGSGEYLKQVDLLARATGQSRKEIEAELAAQQTDAGIRGMLAALDEGTAEYKNLQQSLVLINKLPGPMQTAFKDLTDGVVNNKEETGKMIAMLGDAGPEVQAALKAVGEGADPQILLDAMTKASAALDTFGTTTTGDAQADAANRKILLDAMRQGNNGLMADFADASTEMKKITNTDLKTAQDQQNKANETTKKLTTFDNTIKELRQTIQLALIDSGIFDAIGDAFAGFGDLVGSPEFKTAIKDFVETFAAKTKEFIDLFKEGGFKAVFNNAISGLGGILGDAFTSAITNPKVIAGLVLAFGAIFASKAAIGALSSGLGGLFGGGGGGGGKMGGKPGKAGGGAGAKVGKNIGGFVGGLGEGVMKGAAAGIRAFAHPMVPVGAAAIGAAIVAIGAGIAGATWIIGKSLPTFVEGLSSFETIDGAKLGAAAVGMVQLSGAMAAFGAGTAVAGLGSMVGGITEGIGKLFGAEDPLDKVKRFADANIDGAKVKTNAEALIAFSTAMAAAGGAEAATGLGSLVGGIAGGIGSLFGGDTDPLTNLKTFGDTTINSAQVKTNAEAMVAYASAMSAVSPGATAGLGELVGNIAGGIGKLFGVEASDPTKDLEKFGNLTIDSVKVKTNAEAMVAFGEAMKSLPTTMPGDGAFTSFGKAIAGFFGADTPFEQLTKFGAMELNAEGVSTNAAAMTAFGKALANMPTDEMGTLDLPAKFVTQLNRVANIDGANLKTVVAELSTFSSIPGLKTSLDSLSDVSTEKQAIKELAKALELLVEQMKAVNNEASKEVGMVFKSKEETAAGKMLNSMGGSGNDQLNTTMQRIEGILQSIYIRDKDILDATKANAGNVALAIGS